MNSKQKRKQQRKYIRFLKKLQNGLRESLDEFEKEETSKRYVIDQLKKIIDISIDDLK